MLPIKAMRLELGTLLAADATYLAPAVSANKIALIKAPFTPTELLTVSDLTLADFTGSSPLAGSTGAQLTGLDPNTGQQIITIKEPVGGWRWITTNTVNLPQSIYGFALLDSTLATLLAVALLDTPIPLTETGQQIDIGVAQITFVFQPMA